MAHTGRLDGPGGRRPGRRAPRRARWVLAALLLIPLLEITVIVLVGQWIGPWWTFGALIALCFLGAWLVRREGARTWRRLQETVRSGQAPAREITDAALVFVGGILLLAPGFVTDAIGLFLVLPLTRPLSRMWVQSVVASRIVTLAPPFPAGATGWPPRGWPSRAGRGPEDVIEGEIVGDDGPDAGPRSDQGRA